jgi:prephenate dehydrogenase
VKAARADLFQDAVCVVTPTPATNPAALRTVEALWTALGARVLQLDPVVHDAWVARSSHLPHAVASVLSRCVLDGQPAQDQLRLCASGFRDTTRVASGSPEMWRDIALANAQALGDALAEFDRRLQLLRQAVAARDGVALLEHFTTAKQLRDRWINTQPRSGAPTDRTADASDERPA